jgi:Spy/CpxP family protein refolding chaperone
MKWKWLFTTFVLSIIPFPGWGSENVSPYAGQEQREIKTLSEEEIQGYLSGSGMGFAKAAELNHYPGPKHVLELAEQLHLSAEQYQRTHVLFEEMKAKAVSLGQELVEKESLLDSLFAKAKISEAQLQKLVTEILVIRGKLRFVHLSAHLEQRKILTPAQIQRYDKLRGYDSSGHIRRHHRHKHQ